MCMIDDADGVIEAYSETIRVARKSYRCGECRAPIVRGDRYQSSKGIFDGRWLNERACMACVEGPQAWLRAECGGWLFGAVYEDLREHWEEYRYAEISERMALGRLIIAMKRRIEANLPKARTA